VRIVGLAGMIWITGFALPLAGCSDEPIGQPCSFRWPVTEKVDQNGDVVLDDEGNPELTDDCGSYPTCAPLQKTSEPLEEEPRNNSCPVDCIQMPSLECTNLICVATQVEEDTEVDGVPYSWYRLMNGECNTDLITDKTTSCVQEDEQGVEIATAKFGCKGYCTKECLSNASCPKGYRCTQMAPFGENMRCDNEEEWGDVCTDSCQPTGSDLVDGKKCPSSVEGDTENTFDYGLCDMEEYNHCCTCICYQFCPLLTKKFCRRIQWDHKNFPDGVISPETEKCGEPEE